MSKPNPRSTKIKHLRAARLVIDLMKRRRTDLNIETVEALEEYADRLMSPALDDAPMFVEDFVAELTDILVDLSDGSKS